MEEDINIFVKRTMENNPFYMAPVEIIIPFYDEQSHVAKLMESIFNTVYTNRYLITLVDDGSKNKSFIKDIDKKKLPGVRCLRQNENKGFGAAVNLALKTPWSGKITWIVIMQSDVFAEDNHWLSNMGETMNLLKGKGVKMVAPMTNNPMTESNFLIGKKAIHKEDHILTEGFLPMYCVLAHRELFNRVGFLKECPYASNEAQEYAIRMQKMGYSQAICGKSWINHIGGVTLANLAQDHKAQEILRKVNEEFKKEFINNTYIEGV